MLLDTASLYFRAFYGIPDTLTAPDGTPVNAVRGLLDFITRLVDDHQPTRLVAAMDANWRPDFRVALLPSYKAHRVANPALNAEAVPDLLEAQVPIIEDVLDAIGIAKFGVAGYEADDVIGTLSHAATIPVDIVTGDRDLFQLVDDDGGVRVLYTARGMSKLEVIDNATVVTKYGVPAALYADFAALRGDPSDGLPGVAGVGAKTAAGLLARWGSLEALLTALDDPTQDVGARPKLAGRQGLPGRGADRRTGGARRADPGVRRHAARVPGRPGAPRRAQHPLGPGLTAQPTVERVDPSRRLTQSRPSSTHRLIPSRAAHATVE